MGGMFWTEGRLACSAKNPPSAPEAQQQQQPVQYFQLHSSMGRFWFPDDISLFTLYCMQHVKSNI